MRRVVFTGMGIISSIGNSLEEVEKSLYNGSSGIVFAEDYKEMGFRSHVKGNINVDLQENIDRRLLRFMGDGAAYAYLSMQQAINDSGLENKDVSNIKVQKKSISHKQKYSLQLVDSKDGHPVRSGNKSWRFEVREGDCGGDKKYSDCKSNRQRTELQTKEYQKRNKKSC